MKKASTIQNANRKWGTHARMFSQTLAYMNSKKEIDEEGKKIAVSMERSKAGTKT